MDTLQDQIVYSFQSLWDKLAAFLPNLLAAIIVLILGWLVASLLGQLVQRVLTMIQLDVLANRLGLDRLGAQVGRKLSLAALGGWLIKWFVIVGAFFAAADILNLDNVSNFFVAQVLPYFGHVIAATAILVIGAVAANFLSEVVRGAVRAAGVNVAGAAASITKWSIVVVTVLAALSELQLADDFLRTLYIGIIAMIAIAGGLAFGLGGRDVAAAWLEKLRSEVSNR